MPSRIADMSNEASKSRNTDQAVGRYGFLGRFGGSWRLALGELAIVFLGVLIALWVDQAVQANQDAHRELQYLESLRRDVDSDWQSLQLSIAMAGQSLDAGRRTVDWIEGTSQPPHPDTLVALVHFAGVTFSPTLSRFTIEELQSTGDLRLIGSEALKRQVANYYGAVDLMVGDWSSRMDAGVSDNYFREVGFVLDPELRIRANTLDPELVVRLMDAPVSEAGRIFAEMTGSSPQIGATSEQMNRALAQMRDRPDFRGQLGNAMYASHLKTQTFASLAVRAEDLKQALTAEIERLR